MCDIFLHFWISVLLGMYSFLSSYTTGFPVTPRYDGPDWNFFTPRFTLRPFDRNKFTVPPFHFKDDKTYFDPNLDKVILLAVLIPAFVIIAIFMICKQCFCSKSNSSSYISATGRTLHPPPRLQQPATEVYAGSSGISSAQTNTFVYGSLSQSHINTSRTAGVTALTSDNPPDYATVVVSDLSDQAPRFQAVKTDKEMEIPPPYHVESKQNLPKY